MGHSLIQVEHRPGEELVVRFRPPQLKKFPEATRKHVMAASKETLLALRSLLDATIEYVERAETRTAKRQGRTKIQVE
ncbi:MAG TPA: hypothetical protein G4O03_00270 [Dehalococcoidia bacterium]|jgi:hypothetical protein|nr:hypothetical protein [Dehalococcoidia bacterium]